MRRGPATWFRGGSARGPPQVDSRPSSRDDQAAKRHLGVGCEEILAFAGLASPALLTSSGGVEEEEGSRPAEAAAPTKGAAARRRGSADPRPGGGWRRLVGVERPRLQH